jgi:hypothetical protein
MKAVQELHIVAVFLPDAHALPYPSLITNPIPLPLTFLLSPLPSTLLSTQKPPNIQTPLATCRKWLAASLCQQFHHMFPMRVTPEVKYLLC